MSLQSKLEVSCWAVEDEGWGGGDGVDLIGKEEIGNFRSLDGGEKWMS